MLYLNVHHFIFTVPGLNVALRITAPISSIGSGWDDEAVRIVPCKAEHGGRIFLSGAILHIIIMDMSSTPVLMIICMFTLLTAKFLHRYAAKQSLCHLRKLPWGIHPETFRACIRASIAFLSLLLPRQ